jgi:hypothetical protein
MLKKTYGQVDKSLYNKSVNDYDDNFEICIEAFNDDNVNRKSKFASNLILETKCLMCHTSKQKNVFNISSCLPQWKNMMCMTILMNQIYFNFLKAFNLENNIKILKSLHKNI